MTVDGACEVEALVRALVLRLGHQAQGSDEHGDPDRDVDEEDPRPGEARRRGSRRAGGPTAPPPTAIAAHTPIAFARSAPSANVVVMIESAAGATSAAPSPCSPRQTMRNSELGASPFRSARRR